ncbi:hypothetical protein H2198_000064 [Neophaeococcomyces mojaviensis]|uniref:Uncharacterized protein n=1 Tax=Neophaeococcomyces mojaviensis TaxID=3383035 RepID=A0ACC3AKV9_9EURO|nr:hypothetical protein H2198_000064 [Knufia sp. JES_112]
MNTRKTYDGTHDLTREVSLESYGESNYTSHDDDDSAVLLPSDQPRFLARGSTRLLGRLTGLVSLRQLKKRILRQARRLQRGHSSRFRLCLPRLLWFLYALLGSLVAVIILVGAFFPSYTRLPQHYRTLKQRVQNVPTAGSANIHNEKIYIAASIFDPGGVLASGEWAQDILDLIHILGEDNVYLSIYENDSGPEALDALARLETRVPCNHTLISEAHLNYGEVPHVTLPDGTQRIKRIAYLAEVRNRALKPLEQARVRFDKMLYLNDVVFDPVDAAQLLFSTNIDESGRTNYRAACAVDFINAFKFYDTFATRDLDGYSMGVPFFPWFSAGGGDGTLDDVLGGKDAVRVKSCWGGMVAFDAVFFQNWQGEARTIRTAANESPSNLSAPYRFRAEKDLWWDASECCLIQADIQSPDHLNTGIFVNPFVRVAYDSKTLSWLWFTRRFEKLYVLIHFIADALVSLPHYNPRRHEKAWHTVEEMVWFSDETLPGNGTFRPVTRIAEHSGFCGRPGTLQLILEDGKVSKGRNWEFVDAPPEYAHR